MLLWNAYTSCKLRYTGGGSGGGNGGGGYGIGGEDGNQEHNKTFSKFFVGCGYVGSCVACGYSGHGYGEDDNAGILF